MKPTGIHHVSICVRDTAEAITFYTDVLGFTLLNTRPDFGFPGAWLEAGGEQLHLMEREPSVSVGEHFAVHVEDLDEAVADIRAAGWRVDPVDHVLGAGRQAFLHDPSGNFIELNQPDAVA